MSGYPEREPDPCGVCGGSSKAPTHEQIAAWRAAAELEVPALRHHIQELEGGRSSGEGARTDERAAFLEGTGWGSSYVMKHGDVRGVVAASREEADRLYGGLRSPAPEREGGGIYVASRAHHGAMWRTLREEGFPITSTWIDEAEPGQAADWAELWGRCDREASTAGVLVLYADNADVSLRGAFRELGAALSHGVPVVACVPDSILGNLARDPRIRRTTTLLGALDVAESLLAAPQGEEARAVECEGCAAGYPRLMLDEDGVRAEVSGKPGAVCHASGDAWGPCTAPQGEEAPRA